MVSPSLWYRCRRFVVPGLPASNLPCNTNTNGEYGGWRNSSKPAFWMAASAWADLWSDALSWLQVTSFFLNWKNSWKDTQFSDNEDVICTANGWLEDQEQQFFYNGIRALEKRWTSAFQLQVSMLKSDKIWCAYLVVNCVSLRTVERPS